jgi:hypothetical protein
MLASCSSLVAAPATEERRPACRAKCAGTLRHLRFLAMLHARIRHLKHSEGLRVTCELYELAKPQPFTG